jgi:hypothetical protein
MDPLNGLRRGLLAGAAGITALDAVSYLDMFVRGRPPSDVPGRTANVLAKKLGSGALDGDDARTANRRRASGALIGYADGALSAAALGVVRSAVKVPWPLGAVLLTAWTLAVGEGSAVRAGVTDWTQWSATDWISDIVPRLAYGAVTALALEALQA